MKGITTFLMCLLLSSVTLAGEPNDVNIVSAPGITVWGMTADNADSLLNLRIGYETKQRFEIGSTFKWETSNIPWGPTPDTVGAYAIYHINELLGIDDPEPDNPLEEILHYLVGRPYGGIEMVTAVDRSVRLRTNFILGTLFTVKDDPKFKVAFAIEYTTGDAGEDVATLGLRIKL